MRTGRSLADLRSLLARIWRKAGEEIGFADLLAMADEIDQTAGNYFTNKYGPERLIELVQTAMLLPPGRPRSLRSYVDGRMHTQFLLDDDVENLKKNLARRLKSIPKEKELAQLIEELREHIRS